MNEYGEQNPYQQILDHRFVVDTPSLKIAGNEPVPDEILRDLLRFAWMDAHAPRPKIIIPNDDNRATSKSDETSLAVQLSDYREEYTGHERGMVTLSADWEILLNIPGRGGRQQLWNTVAEVRRIIYRWAKVTTPFQLLSYEGFTPVYDTVNVHKGSCRVHGEAVIPIFSRRIRGTETPASDPDRFPHGLQP